MPAFSVDRIRERQDAAVLGVVVLVTLATWVVFLGWAPRLMLASHDALTLWVPYVRMLTEHAAEASPGGYEWAVLGGTKLREVLGVTWWLDLGARWGLSATAVINVMLLHTQAGLGFFAFRAGGALLDDGAEPASGTPVVPITVVTWLSAFAPVVGWRVEAGHLNLLMGSAAIMATFYVILALQRGTLSVVGALLAWLAMFTALQTHAHQLLVPAGVFLGPLAVVLLLPSRHGAAGWRPLLITSTLLCSAALMSADVSAELISYATSDDAARRPGAESVAHAYHVATGAEWWGSLWWSLDLAAPRVDGTHQHETNLPMGPVILLATWGAFRRSRRVGVAWCAAVLGVIVFSMQWEPFSSVMLRVVPLLGSFRLPARTLLPVCLVSVIFVVPMLAARVMGWTLRNALVGVAPLLLLLIPGVWREVVAWCAAGLLLPWTFRFPATVRTAGAVILATGSLGAFAERHTLFPDEAAASLSLARLTGQLQTEIPSLSNPLNRILLRQFHKLFTLNTGIASGLSTMTASCPGGRRFTSLYTALHGFPSDPTFTLFMLEEGTPPFDVVAALYNVGRVQHPQPDGAVATVVHPTPGAAWFPARQETVDSMPVLAARLLEAHATVVELLKDTLFLTRDDPQSMRASQARMCPNAHVLDTGYEAPVVHVTVTGVEGPCPLVVATNHAQTLRATSVLADGSTQPLQTFVANGSLLGVLLPTGTNRVDLVSPQFQLRLAPLLEGFAWLLLLATVVAVRRVSVIPVAGTDPPA